MKNGRHKRRPDNELAFAEESIPVPMVPDTNRAGCKSTQSSTHTLDFLGIQLASALANQYPVLVIHAFLLFLSFWVPLNSAKSLEKRFLAGRRLAARFKI
jgi:hypothetical protein